MNTLDAVNLVQQIIHVKVFNAQCCVDATAGNGQDTLFLAQMTPPEAKIWSFDIQEQAVYNTKQLLQNNGCSTKVQIVKDNHANLSQYIGAGTIDVALFNLGYLPGGNHAITTTSDDMLKALAAVLERLNIGGIVSLIAYPGHPTGSEESQILKSFLANLPANLYKIGVFTMLNQNNQPPILYLLEKVRSEVREGIATRQN